MLMHIGVRINLEISPIYYTRDLHEIPVTATRANRTLFRITMPDPAQ